jgi:hypothetical protein
VALYDRTVSVRFPGALREISGHITYQRDAGPRITFDFVRSIRAEPDRGYVRIWNLPKEIIDKMIADQTAFKSELQFLQTGVTTFGSYRTDPLAATDLKTLRIDDMTRARRLHALLEQHIIEIWAGYGANAQPIFRGDPITIRPRVRDGLDYFTEIEIGDGFVALEEQWMAQVFGVGETPANLLAFVAALADVGTDDGKMRAAIGLVAPNAITARLSNGWVAKGRPADVIKDVADFLGLYWWVKDGKIEFIARDSYLPDFAVVLDGESTLISTSLTDNGRYRGFECVLAPQIHPGRAIRIIDEWGETFNGRVLETRISGDTHSDEWLISGLADTSTWQSLPMVEPTRGPILKISKEEWERQTNPKTGGQRIPDALKFTPPSGG